MPDNFLVSAYKLWGAARSTPTDGGFLLKSRDFVKPPTLVATSFLVASRAIRLPVFGDYVCLSEGIAGVGVKSHKKEVKLL